MEEEYQTIERLFKAGELVKITTIENMRTGAGLLTITDGMKNLAGTEQTINEVDNVYEGRPLYRIGEFWYEEEWLEKTGEEKVKEEPLKEIKLRHNIKEKDIEEMISKVDIETFIKILQARVTIETNSKHRVTKEMAMKYLKLWARAKFRFYKLFGNKLTTDKMEIEVEKDDKFISEKMCEIRNEFPLYTPIFERLDRSDIKNNKYTNNSDSVFERNDKVKKGMKLTRLIALYKNTDLDMAFSKIYQEKPIKDLYISIDPCDYLTVSINTSGWRSCHNFIDGEWRNAGLSLMLDNVSMVSYSCKEKVSYTFENEKFKWNSKNWRQMVYLSTTNSQLMFSLQYPYQSEVLAKAVRSKMEEMLSEHLKIENRWVVKNTNDNIKINCSRLMYNDIGRSGCKYAINKYDSKKSCTINTGSYIETINGEDDVNGGDDYLWI